ncbi:MAG: CPBP family intramembrane metalloprotease [Bacilli bacterium]|nr:CPBP family intramembrane metalloprotease [Bacilli bacterium]
MNKEKLYNLLKILFSLLCFFNIGSILKLVLKLFNIDLTTISTKGLVIYQLVLSLIMFSILLLIYFKDIKKDFKKLKGNIKSSIWYIIKTFIIFMIVKYIVSFISVLIMTLLGFDTTSFTSVNQNLIQDYIKVAPILMVFTTSFLGPFYEEILFRLGFKKVLGKGIWFVIISGFIFGVMHVFPLEEGIPLALGIVQSISYVTMGIFLAHIYNKTDNIFLSIGVHFLNNFLSVLTMINMI